MTRNGRKRTFGHVRLVKIQISIRVVLSDSSICAFWIAKDTRFPFANKEDADRTVRMRRLI